MNTYSSKRLKVASRHSPIFPLSKRGGSISKKLWWRKQGWTTGWRVLNREECSLLGEVSVIRPLNGRCLN